MRSHNLTGRLASAFVTSKVTVVLMIACFVLGIWAVIVTPREENPQIAMPVAVVEAMLVGADPQEIEEKVVRPLEEAIVQIPGVEHVTVGIRESGAALIVQFEVGQDRETSLVKVSERVAATRMSLPPNVIGPGVRSADSDDVPVLALTLTARDSSFNDEALTRLAERMQEELLSLKDISTLSIVGGTQQEVRIALDAQRLQSYGMTVAKLKAALAASNLNLPMGEYVENNRVVNVKLENDIRSLDDLNNLVVGLPRGIPVRLGDVADISIGPRFDRAYTARFGFGLANERFQDVPNEMPAVTLAVAKKKGTNAVTLVEQVNERVDRMVQTWMPKGVEVHVTRDDGKKADEAVNRMIKHLAISVVAVICVTWAFLGWRSAAIVTITVPLILALTLTAVNFAGLTINRLTLLGLIVALGLLVDDSIVVIENIVRHYGLRPMKDYQDRLQRTVDAPDEIGNATLLATVAVMLVFASLVPALTGMSKQYFYPVGFAVPIALGASFFVAYIVAPWAAARWIPNEVKGMEPRLWNRLLAWIIDGYRRAMAWLLATATRERCFLFGITLAIVLVMLMPTWQLIRPAGPAGPTPALGVSLGFLPKDNRNTFNIVVELPEGTAVEVTDRVVRDVASVVRTLPDVTDYQSWAGIAGVPDLNSMISGDVSAGSHIGAVRVNLVDKNIRDASSVDITLGLREQLQSLMDDNPELKIRVVEEPPGPPLKSTILAELYARDLETLNEASEVVINAFQNTPDLIAIKDSTETPVQRLSVSVDAEKAWRAGIAPAMVAEALAAHVSGSVLGWAHFEGERHPQPIRLQVPDDVGFTLAMLDEVTVESPDGKQVPISTLVKVENTVAPAQINHKNGVRMAWVGAEMVSGVPTYAQIDVSKRVDGVTLSDGSQIEVGNLGLDEERPDTTLAGVHLLWQGEIRMMLNAYRDLIVALAGSIGLIGLLLVAYYRSFQLAGIALSAIPLALLGVFPGHCLLNAQFSATSLIGIVALSGVVVRNSLLIIDFAQEFRHKGENLQVALVDAGAVRLRPILLTTLAIIFGSLIMLTEPSFNGLAISFIFGTLSSTIFTVFMIPIMLHRYYQRQSNQ